MRNVLLATVAAFCAISAQASLFEYSVSFNGPNEPTTSAGLGIGVVDYNDAAHTLKLQMAFFGLTNVLSGTTASHIHAATVNPFTGTAGVATTTPTFAGFPLGGDQRVLLEHAGSDLVIQFQPVLCNR